MRGQIPEWRGDLTSTCQQFEHWQQARHRVIQTFFSMQTPNSDGNQMQNSHTLDHSDDLSDLKDPTDYK
jgi:beta-N-acetylhexosaminidase